MLLYIHVHVHMQKHMYTYMFCELLISLDAAHIFNMLKKLPMTNFQVRSDIPTHALD